MTKIPQPAPKTAKPEPPPAPLLRADWAADVIRHLRNWSDDCRRVLADRMSDDPDYHARP